MSYEIADGVTLILSGQPVTGPAPFEADVVTPEMLAFYLAGGHVRLVAAVEPEAEVKPKRKVSRADSQTD